MKKRIVIKVGTSSLTYDTGKINIRQIELLSQVISDLCHSGCEVALVTSGAIADYTVDLNGKQASNALRSVFLSRGEERCKVGVRVNHFYSDCVSNSLVKGVAQKGLNLSDVKLLPIPVPDISIQKQLVMIYEQLDKSKYIEYQLPFLTNLAKNKLQSFSRRNVYVH